MSKSTLKGSPMTEQAQVGDTVRLTIAIEGEVKAFGNSHYVKGWDLAHPFGTVEILSRATPPLPSEPGTFWLDRFNSVWSVDSDNYLYSIADEGRILPEDYAPFRQLVLK